MDKEKAPRPHAELFGGAAIGGFRGLCLGYRARANLSTAIAMLGSAAPFSGELFKAGRLQTSACRAASRARQQVNDVAASVELFALLQKCHRSSPWEKLA